MLGFELFDQRCANFRLSQRFLCFDNLFQEAVFECLFEGQLEDLPEHVIAVWIVSELTDDQADSLNEDGSLKFDFSHACCVLVSVLTRDYSLKLHSTLFE